MDDQQQVPQTGQPVYPVQYVLPVVPATTGTNGFAIASLVLSLLWGYGIGSVLAIVFAAVSFRQIKERNQGGNGLAVAGLVIGILGAVLALIIILIAAAASSATSTVAY